MGQNADGQPVTRLLQAAARGDEQAGEELLVYLRGSGSGGEQESSGGDESDSSGTPTLEGAGVASCG